MPTMTCSRCRGTGRVELPPELQATLDLLVTGPSTPPELAQRAGCAHTAMCNRLVKLFDLGWVKRERLTGNSWLYYSQESLSGRRRARMRPSQNRTKER